MTESLPRHYLEDMIELERTFLAKSLPPDLASFPSKTITDRYIPVTADHPILRLRKNGERTELTKKQPKKDGDASEQIEETITLSEEEYTALESIPSKVVEKLRYAYTQGGFTYEIDVFQKELLGLVLVDIEFTDLEEKNAFVIPTFCLTEVTQESFIAGGMLCGKSYTDIESTLTTFHYTKLSLDN